MHLYIRQANFITTPRFEIVHFHFANFQGSIDKIPIWKECKCEWVLSVKLLVLRKHAKGRLFSISGHFISSKKVPWIVRNDFYQKHICFCPYPYNHSKINHFCELQVVGGMPMKVMIAEPKVRKGSRTKKSSSHMWEDWTECDVKFIASLPSRPSLHSVKNLTKLRNSVAKYCIVSPTLN